MAGTASWSSDDTILYFGAALLSWHDKHPRDLPWVGNRDPYKVWLSEVILQQTRVAQGMPYYHRFVESFPTLKSLAEADEDRVMKLWEGLGYYSRARNLHDCAKTIWYKYSGRFPDNSRELEKLPGIGKYTASAIASFAFREQIAVVDGNVYRVLSRYFADPMPIDASSSYSYYYDMSSRCMENLPSWRYNQAIMDLGATVCTARNPLCQACPIATHCQALKREIQHKLPTKKKRNPKKIRKFSYFVIIHEDNVLIQKRSSKDIWKGLYEFPLREQGCSSPNDLVDIVAIKDKEPHHITQSQLSHQTIKIQFYKHQLRSTKALNLPDDICWIPINRLNQLSFPRPIGRYVQNYLLHSAI